MRKTTNELFNLIKSLSKSEKVYFKKFSSLHIIGKENKYIKLFDIIDKQKTYDENKIKESFIGDPFVKQLHVAKNYLYKIILKSLNQYYSDSTISVKINNLINSAIILYRKGLYNESSRILSKGKLYAKKYGKFDSLIQIINLEKKLTAETNPREYPEKAIEYTNEKEKSNRRIFNIISFEHDLNKVRQLYQSGRIIRKKEEIENYNSIINSPAYRDESKAEEFESKYNLFTKFLNYYMAVADDYNAYLYAKKVIKTLESNPEYIKEHTSEYVSMLKTCLQVILFLKNFEDSKKYINKLNSLKPLSVNLQNKIQFIISNFLITKYIRTGEFEKCLKIIPKIEYHLKVLPGNERKLFEEKVDYSLSYIYLVLENYEKALEHINKILNTKDKSTKVDIVSYAHILNLIIHYELNNIELLPYIIKNTYRFLIRKKKLYNVEREILIFIRKIPDYLTEKQQLNAFRQLKENMIKITKDPYERIALDYFDFISWLESKITKKKFSELVNKQ